MTEKMKVEIRWRDSLGSEDRDPFHVYLKWVDKKDESTAMEDVFKMWLAEEVEGRKLLVSDLEFTIDDEPIEISREEENEYFRRMGDAAGK